MKRPAVFFDRDNTLIANDGYLGDPEKVVLIPGAALAIARLRSRGFAIVTISNQSGVARGLFDEDAVHAVNERMEQLLTQADPEARIDRHEFCPFHPEAAVEPYRQDSPLRKPAPGMLVRAAEALGLDLSQSWMIGDAPRDVEAGWAAGCRTILFKNPQATPSPASAREAIIRPDFEAASLTDAADVIIREIRLDLQADEDDPGEKKEAQDTVDSNKDTKLDTDNDETDDAEDTDESGVGVGLTIVNVAEIRKSNGPATIAPLIGAVIDQAVEKVEKPQKPIERIERDHPAAEISMPAGKSRVESQLDQVIHELRRQHEQKPMEFSVIKLMAGIIQVVAIAFVFFAYVYHGDTLNFLVTALVFQAMTIAFLIMHHQK